MTYKLILPLVLVAFVYSCTKDQKTTPVASNLYTWEILDITDYPFINHLYEDGYYFANTVNPDNGDQFFMKVDERNGDILFKTQLVKGGDLPNTISSGHYFWDNKIIYLWDRYIFHLNKQTGDIIHIDTFPNYVYKHNFYNGWFTGQSYADGFTKFRFYEFVYDGSRFTQEDIHAEYFTHTATKIDVGSPPFKTTHGWVMSYARSKEPSQIIYIENGEVKKYELPTKDNSAIAGHSYTYGNYVFFSSKGEIFKIDMNDASKYQILSYATGSNFFIDYNGFIYYMPIYTQDPQSLIKFNPFTNVATKFPIYAPYLSKPIIVKDTLCFPQNGYLLKFCLKTETWAKPRESEFQSLGYLASFGASENSKLLFNERGYFCFPF